MKSYIQSKISIVKGGCWEWQGVLTNGYATAYWKGGHMRAHRFSWAAYQGPIPQGLYVCHSCDNRKCVNPSHLWLGTQSQNMKDASLKGRLPKNRKPSKRVYLNALKTHCHRGHEYAGENLYKSKSGRRTCKICRRALQKILRAKP